MWCGTGWTGQPNVIQHEDGSVEIREGAYDGHYHFLDGKTGQPVMPDLVTGDLAKGSATSDPDGYPLYYAGSRDNDFRIVALDRPEPTVLWKMNANSAPNPVWNDDWDGAALVVGDYLLEGGENSWFYVIKLNRSYDANGLVQVDPEDRDARPRLRPAAVLGPRRRRRVDRELRGVPGRGGVLRELGRPRPGVGHQRHPERRHRRTSGSSGSGTATRPTPRSSSTTRDTCTWAGTASFNIPSRPQERSHEVGSLMKLDPSKPNDPLVWSVQIGGFEPDGGILGTPALYKGVVYVTDTAGALVAVNQDTGKIMWQRDLPGPTWGSPVPIDDHVLVGDCSGVLHSFDVSKPSVLPVEEWTVKLDDSCIESTPAVWQGMIYVGTRGGAIYGIGDPSSAG